MKFGTYVLWVITKLFRYVSIVKNTYFQFLGVSKMAAILKGKAGRGKENDVDIVFIKVFLNTKKKEKSNATLLNLTDGLSNRGSLW